MVANFFAPLILADLLFYLFKYEFFIKIIKDKCLTNLIDSRNNSNFIILEKIFQMGYSVIRHANIPNIK